MTSVTPATQSALPSAPPKGPVPPRRRATEFSADLAAQIAAIPDDLAELGPVSGVPAGGLTRRPEPETAAPVSIPLLPGERTPARRVKFAIANGCTIASLLLGMVAVFLSIHGEIRYAALALLGCVAFDGFDGGLARKFGVASPFGAQMDSLADLSSFGVATGVVVYQWLTDNGASALTAAPACALVVVCAAVRLARFNVSPKDGRFFTGVPTTMAAAMLAIGVLLLGPTLNPGTKVIAVTVFALAMVSSFPYAKLMRVLRLPPALFVVPLIGAFVNVQVTFALLVGVYLVSGPLLWLRNRGSTRIA